MREHRDHGSGGLHWQRPAIVKRATVAFVAVLFGAVLSASSQQQPGDTDAPTNGNVMPGRGPALQAVLPTGESVSVYPAASNERDPEATRDHVYLYLPPLTLERDSDGQVMASETRTGVRVLLGGVSQEITNGLHEWLANQDLLPTSVNPGSLNVRPLQYDRIRILDADTEADAQWEAFHPPNADGVIPVLQEQIVFVFRPLEGTSESRADFIARLNDPDRLRSLSAVVSYGGMMQTMDSLILNATLLRETKFLVELEGNGKRGLVTRDQARELVSKHLTDVTQRLYQESAGPVNLNAGWLDSGLFQRVVQTSGEEFWAREENLRRVGFSGDDLRPDYHREMRQRTVTELLEESDEKLSQATSNYWNRGQSTVGGGFSLLGFGANASITTPSRGGGEAERVDKAEFRKYLEAEDSSFEWAGEIIVPKDVELYQVDDQRLDAETRLASTSVQNTRARASLRLTIHNRPPPPPPSTALSTDVARLPTPSPPRPARGPGDMFRDCEECPQMVMMAGSQLAMGRYEVTVGEYRAFAFATGRGGAYRCLPYEGSWLSPGFPQTEGHPVTCVNWHDAQDYVSWLSRRTGASYRLPTEAEWVWAAGGSQTGCGSRSTGTCPVGSHGSNTAGLSDMVGNLWEWTSDCWRDDCGRRVLRGGSWDSAPQRLRPGARLWGAPGQRLVTRGFRVSRTVD